MEGEEVEVKRVCYFFRGYFGVRGREGLEVVRVENEVEKGLFFSWEKFEYVNILKRRGWL